MNYNMEATPDATEDENGRKVEWLTPINNYVENGNLVLKAAQTDTRYQGTEIRTKEMYSYGYYEIRAKMNVSQGMCAGFWLCGSRDAESKIEYEIDIFENFGLYPDLVKQTGLAHNYPNGSTGEKTGTQNMHWVTERLTDIFPNTGLEEDVAASSYFEIFPDEEYHTYGLDWREDSITWYIDGVATMKIEIPEDGIVGKNTGIIYKFDEPLGLCLTVYCDRDVAGKCGLVEDGVTDFENGASMTVDYVRIYQYN